MLVHHCYWKMYHLIICNVTLTSCGIFFANILCKILYLCLSEILDYHLFFLKVSLLRVGK
jgi:hypothetical protein